MALWINKALEKVKMQDVAEQKKLSKQKRVANIS